MSTAGALTLTTVSGTTYATTTMASGSSLSLANGTASYTASSGGDATVYTYTKAFVYDANGAWGAYSGATIKALGSTTVTAFAASGTQMGFADVRGGTMTDATAYTISSSTATAQTITAVTSGYVENEDGTVSYTAPMTLTYSGGTISATTVLAPVSYGIENQEAINSMIAVVPDPDDRGHRPRSGRLLHREVPLMMLRAGTSRSVKPFWKIIGIPLESD